MPATPRFCAEQVQRLAVLRDAGYRFQAAFRPLWEALSRYAASNEEAEAAITLLLDDAQRAADPHRNGIPEPGELQTWVLAARGGQEGSPEVTLPGLCGWCEQGWVRGTFEKRGMTYSGVGKCTCQGGNIEPERKQLSLEQAQ